MLFVEPRFFIFFFVVALIYWNLRSNRSRKFVLLVASYTFYAAWDYRFLSLILLSTLVDYAVALKIDKTVDPMRRKSWLLASLIVNLGVLGVFKYLNFFGESFAELMSAFGVEASYNTLNIILPVGISFYTFQTLSYTIDVYRKHINAKEELLDVAVFVAFFPQLVAGPIVRAVEFLPQLESVRRFSAIPVKACLTLFLIGFIKKAGISDNIAPYIDLVFSSPEQYNATAIYAAVLLYAAQIYCDFSGYSDMAIAVAGLLGYRLPLNFAAPYFSSNLAEFWRRWHITLSSWLRDYLYISIGGNRSGEVKTYRNLMITMLLGGLWHGASWNFIIWGALHGAALSIHRGFRAVHGHKTFSNFLVRLISGTLTFYWVCLAWIFFRAQNLNDALAIANVWVLGSSTGVKSLPYDDWVLLLLGALALHWVFSRIDVLDVVEKRMPWPIFAFSYGAALSLAIAFIPMGYRPFIYFQF